MIEFIVARVLFFIIITLFTFSALFSSPDGIGLTVIGFDWFTIVANIISNIVTTMNFFIIFLTLMFSLLIFYDEYIITVVDNLVETENEAQIMMQVGLQLNPTDVAVQ